MQDHLKAVCQLSDEQVDAVEKATTELEGQLLTLPKLIEDLSGRIGDEGLAASLLSFGAIARSAPKSKRHVDALRAEIVAAMKEADFDEEEVSRFEEISGPILDFSVSDISAMALKVSELFYSSEKHVHEIKFYTNSKPVFDINRKKIRGYIVNTNLIATISDKNENESVIEVSVSLSQLKQILERVSSAIEKLKITAEHLSASTGLSVVSDLEEEGE
jgi:hypothetical protein